MTIVSALLVPAAPATAAPDVRATSEAAPQEGRFDFAALLSERSVPAVPPDAERDKTPARGAAEPGKAKSAPAAAADPAALIASLLPGSATPAAQVPPEPAAAADPAALIASLLPGSATPAAQVPPEPVAATGIAQPEVAPAAEPRTELSRPARRAEATFAQEPQAGHSPPALTPGNPPPEAPNLAEPAPPPVQVEAPAISPPPAQAQSTGAPEPARHNASLPMPVSHPRWGQEAASRLTWLAGERIQSAELHVQPPELGPVQVSLRVDAKEASIVLSAPHADTRHALEGALPLLREMLQERGIVLEEASVGSSISSGHGHARGGGHPAGYARQEQDLLDAPPAASAPNALQLVDVFA